MKKFSRVPIVWTQCDFNVCIYNLSSLLVRNRRQSIVEHPQQPEARLFRVLGQPPHTERLDLVRRHPPKLTDNLGSGAHQRRERRLGCECLQLVHGHHAAVCDISRSHRHCLRLQVHAGIFDDQRVRNRRGVLQEYGAPFRQLTDFENQTPRVQLARRGINVALVRVDRFYMVRPRIRILEPVRLRDSMPRMSTPC